ncbi:MAG: hypothetical protein QME51_10545 [Planctomycetota bacterium]|nr:hypothetical protein [Planctomycetota bacterium]
MAYNLTKALLRLRFYLKEPPYSLPSYSAGTVAVTLAIPTVTGTGTTWLTNIKAGETFHISAGRYYSVLSVDSNTQLTLVENYAGATAEGQSYTVKGGQFTDAALVDDLNASQREISADVTKLDENYFATSGTISYVSGTETYSLPTTNGVVKRILLVRRTDLTYEKELHRIYFQERKKYLADTGTANSDNLYEHFYLLGQTIGIVPKPTASATNNITIHYIPEATDLTTDASTTILPDDLVELWIIRAVMRKTADPNIWNMHKLLWTQMHSTIQRTTGPEHIVYKDEEAYR